MNNGLFRKEVVDACRGDWLGSINVAIPLSRWLLALLAFGLGIAMVLFMIFGHYTRRARVVGELVPTAGILSVKAQADGTVSNVGVQEGQRVARGDPLLQISGDTSSASLGDTRADISKRLKAQAARLESDLATQRQSSRQQTDELKQQIALYRQQERQVRSQRALQQKRVASDRELLKRIQPLGDKGYISAFQIQQQQAQLLQDETQEKSLARQALSLAQQINDARQKLAQVPLQLTTQRNATQRQLEGIKQQLAKNEAARSIVERAPRGGIVSTLLVQPGQTVSAGQPLLSILPRRSRLQAQLLVTSRSIGFVEPGSRVVLRYRAYPYQKFGQRYGKVSAISRSALSPAEVLALTGRQTRQPLYRVKVRLDSQYMLAYGKRQPLKPGMALDADILMDRRSLLEWAFSPLYGLARHTLSSEQVRG